MALTDNIVYYTKLDGNSNDAVGSNNGTDTSITYSSGNGKINQGAGFTSASSSKIDIATTSFPTGSGARTINFWFKPVNTTAQGQCMFGYGDATSNAAQLCMYINSGGNKIRYGGFANDLDIAQTLTGGTYYMLTFTFNGTTAEVFVNGSSIGSDNKSSWNTVASNGGIGYRRHGPDSYGDSAMDELGIWTRVLSGAEITELYNAGVGKQYPFSSGPANLKSLSGNLKANIKSLSGDLIANVKTFSGNS